MLDHLPLWAHPAARVALALALIGAALLTGVIVVLVGFPQVATILGGYLVGVMGLAGTVALFCACYIGFFIVARGQSRGDW